MSHNERLFNVSDAELLQHAETVAASLGENISAFTGFDSTFTETYPATIAATIAEVKAIQPDQVVIDEQARLTEIMNEKLAACNTTYRTIAYFVRKAFADSPAVQNQFGLNDIEKARKSQPQMILCMESLAVTAQKYGRELQGAGCNSTVIDGVAADAAALKVANTEQEKFKKDRGLITQERVQKLNALYRILKPLSEVAQIIYADNPTILGRYTLPRPKSSADSSDDLITS